MAASGFMALILVCVHAAVVAAAPLPGFVSGGLLADEKIESPTAGICSFSFDDQDRPGGSPAESSGTVCEQDRPGGSGKCISCTSAGAGGDGEGEDSGSDAGAGLGSGEPRFSFDRLLLEALNFGVGLHDAIGLIHDHVEDLIQQGTFPILDMQRFMERVKEFVSRAAAVGAVGVTANEVLFKVKKTAILIPNQRLENRFGEWSSRNAEQSEVTEEENENRFGEWSSRNVEQSMVAEEENENALFQDNLNAMRNALRAEAEEQQFNEDHKELPWLDVDELKEQLLKNPDHKELPWLDVEELKEQLLKNPEDPVGCKVEAEAYVKCAAEAFKSIISI